MSVVVVGAGVAGLVAARDLARRGHDVVVVDPAGRAGGCVAAHVVGGMVLDSGAESFATRSPVVADLVTELGLDGVVAVNTTIAHDYGEGGLSGPPLLARGLEVTRRLRDRLGPAPTLIGVGGVTSGRDAQAYLDAGADLVQGYTGLVYEGPFWAAHVHRDLAAGATP